MSKDSKYSNLPNIAVDQTDVYETSGEPERKPVNLNASKFMNKSDFNQSFFEQADSKNDNLDTINLNAKDAFAKFKGMFYRLLNLS